MRGSSGDRWGQFGWVTGALGATKQKSVVVWGVNATRSGSPTTASRQLARAQKLSARARQTRGGGGWLPPARCGDDPIWAALEPTPQWPARPRPLHRCGGWGIGTVQTGWINHCSRGCTRGAGGRACCNLVIASEPHMQYVSDQGMCFSDLSSEYKHRYLNFVVLSVPKFARRLK